MYEEERKVFIDSNVIFDFIEIGRLDLLARLFNKMHVVPAVDSEVKKDREKYEIYRENFPMLYPEAEWEQELADMNADLIRRASDADRSAAIATKNTRGILLTGDNLLAEEAVKYLGMSRNDLIKTEFILLECVKQKMIPKKDALMYCDDISETRRKYNDLDISIIEKLPD